MKNNLIMLLCAAFMSMSVYAQKISADKVSAAVMTTFKVKFPSAENVTWEMETAGEYEASFKSNTVEQSATFDRNGRWVSTETEINVSELPETVTQAIAKQFAGFKTTEASKVEHTRHGSCYEAEIVKEKESYDVLVSSKGEVLSKQTEKEDGEDEDNKKD